MALRPQSTPEEVRSYTEFIVHQARSVSSTVESLLLLTRLSHAAARPGTPVPFGALCTDVQLSRKSPDRFLRRAAEIIREGWGQPSVFNADMVVEELLRQGKSVVDARMGGTSGCVETGVFGREAYILTGYLNLSKILEVTLHDGLDPRTAKVIGLHTGDPGAFASYDKLFGAFKAQLHHFVDIKVRGNNVMERLYAEQMPAPFLSLFVEDCIARGRDYNDGSPRYNSTYIQVTAPGSCTDSVSALKAHVFEQKDLTMDEVLAPSTPTL